MPIPSHNFNAAMALDELDIQCLVAGRTFLRIEEGSEGWRLRALDRPDTAAPAELLALCSVFFSTCGVIHKMSFASPEAPPSRHARREKLRNLIGLKELPDIRRAMRLRNALEHFDERLDRALEQRTASIWESVRIDDQPPTADSVTTRWLRPSTLEFHCMGDSASIRACVAEADALRIKVEAGRVRLTSEHVVL